MSKKILSYLFLIWIFVGAISAHLAGPYSLIDGSDVYLLGHPWLYGILKGGIVGILIVTASLSYKKKAEGFKVFLIL
ncbi:MAG: hypothetical protein ACPGED_10230, partial [Flavobacteriales bacterium]